MHENERTQPHVPPTSQSHDPQPPSLETSDGLTSAGPSHRGVIREVHLLESEAPGPARAQPKVRAVTDHEGAFSLPEIICVVEYEVTGLPVLKLRVCRALKDEAVSLKHKATK